MYRGFDERLHRPVALKIMHPHLADNPEFISRFSREARSAARLTHPHVVSLYDQGEDRGRVYLAMQLVEGGTLRDELRSEGPLPLKRALRVGRDVLSALDAAHRSGIIHRDIKPENVLVNREHDILVADFGLARAVGSATTSATGTMLGTVAYVSPEVVTRGVSDARSDLYSWGIMMFEMLTGRTPFQGDSAVHIAYKHAHDDIPAPSHYAPELPPSIDALVTWAAARLPSSRPARAHEVLLALDEALDTLTPAQLSARAPRASATTEDDGTAGMPALTRHFDASAPEDDTSRTPARDEPRKPAGILAAFVASTRAAGAEGEGERGAQARVFTPAAVDADDESIREVSVPARTRPAGWHTRGKRTSSVFRAASIAALIVGLGTMGVAGQQWYVNDGPGSVRTVPLLAGASLTDAESALKADGLKISTTTSFSDSVPKGHVIEASPVPGTEVKRGDSISVKVSQGEKLFPIPDIAGKPADEARTALTELGFVVTEDTEYSDDVPQGAVIRHEATGPALASGSPVTMIVSDGPEPIEIPRVVGQGKAQARKALEDAGFTVAVSQAHASKTPAGAIASQNPASGTGTRGQKITIVESLGPDMVKVPDVFQKPEAEAKAALEAAGLKPSVQYDRGKPVLGLVYQQSVAGGQEAERGSTVTINVF